MKVIGGKVVTALQLILLNGILAFGCGLLAYFMTHGKKHNKQNTNFKHK